MVFTDNGSKDLNLESEIIGLRKANECEVFIILTPAYEGKFNGPAYYILCTMQDGPPLSGMRNERGRGSFSSKTAINMFSSDAIIVHHCL